MTDLSKTIVLFDGICNLCNSSVKFLLTYNQKKNLYFSPLQSAKANELLNSINWNDKTMNSLIFIENNQAFIKSQAVFKIAKHLTYPWKIIYYFRNLPKPFCDWVYKIIAKNRYTWFGKKQYCMMPKKEWESRFL